MGEEIGTAGGEGEGKLGEKGKGGCYIEDGRSRVLSGGSAMAGT